MLDRFRGIGYAEGIVTKCNGAGTAEDRADEQFWLDRSRYRHAPPPTIQHMTPNSSFRNGPHPAHAGWGLYAATGQRKYLNREERERFVEAAADEAQSVQALCLILAYTGCRISEALMLTALSVQPSIGVIAIRTLKKRGRLFVREVPVPNEVARAVVAPILDMNCTEQLLPFGRTHAWTQVKRVMAKADIHGPHASPRGLRHGFGVAAVQAGVPLTLVQKWLGHANIATTAIYTNAVGPEERAIAKRMW